MKKPIIALGACLVLTVSTQAHDVDRTDKPLNTAEGQVVEHVRATVGVFGFLVNQQFLYTQGPAVTGRDLHFTLMLTAHDPGSFLLMIGSEAWPNGPFVSLYGGPFSQVLISGVTTTLGPFAHDGIQGDVTLRIPQDPALLGQAWYAQAAVTGGFVDLSSAVGGVIGNHL